MTVVVWMRSASVGLKTWFPFGGNIWEGLGSVASLEEVCHRQLLLRFQQLTPVLLSLLLPRDYISGSTSQPLRTALPGVPDAMFPAMITMLRKL